MKTRLWLCLLSLLLPVAWADTASKAAKLAELQQLTGARQFLHEVDGKLDQEEAVRAWGRAYGENVTESDLDAILAYYRSPAGQRDVMASRAALEQVQHSVVAKRTAVTSGAAPVARVESPPTRASGGQGAVAPAATGVGSAPAGATRPWDSAPRAPDGRFVASIAIPERCEAPAAAATRPIPSGRSVVCVCTDEKGALVRDPVIAESSGDVRVDSGALKMARIDSGRYIPPTLDGHPQSACFRFAIDFSGRH